jgi:hypothetical protein
LSGAAGRLRKAGFRLEYASREGDPDGEGKKKMASKTKFTCAECGQNAWAKPGAQLLCGACYEESGEAVAMEPEG